MSPKTKKVILYSIPILVGVYFIIKGLRAKAQDPFKGDLKKDVGKTVPASVKKVIASSDDCTYPIKKGDGSVSNPCKQVWEIQYALNAFSQDFPYKPLVTDGDFGSKTEAALMAVYGKKQIDNEADLNALYAKQKESVYGNAPLPTMPVGVGAPATTTPKWSDIFI